MTGDHRDPNAPVLTMVVPNPDQATTVRTLMLCIKYMLVNGSQDENFEVTQAELEANDKMWDLHAEPFGNDSDGIRLRVELKPGFEVDGKEPPFKVVDAEDTAWAAQALAYRASHSDNLN